MGRKQFLLKKYIELYRDGKCSIDKAAEEIGITVNEMMKEASKAGIKSEETIEEYQKGLRLLG
jgi:predicted HTH domain antitoxin